MNQRGSLSKTYLARIAAAPEDQRTVQVPEAAAGDLTLGARILFYEPRGDDDAKGSITGWGEVERLSTEDGAVTIRLREFHALKRRVPFTDLRSDPRRDRAAVLQPISPEVFNTAMAKARR